MAADPPITVVERGGGTTLSYLGDILIFRDALRFMILRDIKVRYTQTVLGFGWAVVQPFTQVIVFSVFFGHFAHLASGGLPYPLFSIAGVVPWSYFSNTTTSAAGSLVGGAATLRRIYLPRVLLPLTPIVAGLLDLLIGVALLVAVMGAYGRTPPATGFLYLPLLLLATVFAVLAFSIWLAPLGVLYRDVRYVAPFLIQTLMFVTPVIYSASVVPHSLRHFYELNPMVGVINGFRAAFLHTEPMPWASLGLSYLVSIVFIALGLTYFRRAERVFADIA